MAKFDRLQMLPHLIVHLKFLRHVKKNYPEKSYQKLKEFQVDVIDTSYIEEFYYPDEVSNYFHVIFHDIEFHRDIEYEKLAKTDEEKEELEDYENNGYCLFDIIRLPMIEELALLHPKACEDAKMHIATVISEGWSESVIECFFGSQSNIECLTRYPHVLFFGHYYGNDIYEFIYELRKGLEKAKEIYQQVKEGTYGSNHSSESRGTSICESESWTNSERVSN